MTSRSRRIALLAILAGLALAISACASSSSPLPTTEPYRWVFSSASPIAWTVDSGTIRRTGSGHLQVYFNGATVLHSPPNLYLDPLRYAVVMVRAKTWNDDDDMTLYWVHGSRVESMDLPIVNSGQDFYTYYFDLSQNPSWSLAASIPRIGLSPTNQDASGDVEIEEIRILPMTRLLGARIRWNEFSRPEYLSQFGKILSVSGPRLEGQPINAIAYWLMAIGFAAIGVAHALRRSLPRRLRRIDSRAALGFGLALSLILAVRLGWDQWHTLEQDIARFAGRPVLERQSALFSGSYRPFLQFAQDTLPASSAVRLVVNDLAFWMGQYYLYPLRVSDTASMYLVYDFPNGQDHFQFDPTTGTLLRIKGEGTQETIGNGLALLAKFDEFGAIYETRR